MVMLVLGGAIVKASTTDVYLRYVKHGLRPVLIVGGCLLIAAAAMTLWYETRAIVGETAEDGHGHGEARLGWLLVLPVIGLLIVEPPALGAYTAAQSGSILTAQTAASDYAPLPPGDPVQIGLLDYASRAVFDHGRSLAGRNLELSGFVAPGPDGQLMLARIVVSCCAADGRPIKVGLTGDGPTGVATNTWLEVVGRYTPTTGSDPVNGAAVPYLQVTSWQQIAEPAEPYDG
jgi:uncharacterized repeat protein (TIGR03943 family)